MPFRMLSGTWIARALKVMHRLEHPSHVVYPSNHKIFGIFLVYLIPTSLHRGHTILNRPRHPDHHRAMIPWASVC